MPLPEVVGFAQMGPLPRAVRSLSPRWCPVVLGAILCAQKVHVTRRALPWLPKWLLSCCPKPSAWD